MYYLHDRFEITTLMYQTYHTESTTCKQWHANMRLHYQLSMFIESWYWKHLWPGMPATIGSLNDNVKFGSTEFVIIPHTGETQLMICSLLPQS